MVEKLQTLANGNTIPALGFGTWQLAVGEETYQAVKHALEVGYRHVDTAQTYKNEASVGQAMKDSSLDREEIFLTTKVWNTNHTYDATRQSVEESLEKLQTDYLDLLLIHWPNPQPLRENKQWQERNKEVWRAMEDLYEEGVLKAIGVSNFYLHHLEALLETARITPMVNQIKLSPGLTQDQVVEFCRDLGIVIEAYSPLGSGDIFSSDLLAELADKYDRSIAQIALRYSLEKGYVTLPRSKTPAHIEANSQIFDFELEPADVTFLDQAEDLAEGIDPDSRPF